MRYHHPRRAFEQGAPTTPYSTATIRVLDMAICAVALIALLPLALLVAAIVYAQDRGPIIFAQRRMGLDGRSFRCMKFRTMVLDADVRLRALLESDPQARKEWQQDQKLRLDPRVTPAGRLLRKLSLDELPQLLNVLRGEMSLVGPRPIVPDEAARYGKRYWNYCTTKPGITGIWQISGRNEVRYGRRVAMDVLFARTPSVSLYARILLGTMPALLLRRGAY